MKNNIDKWIRRDYWSGFQWSNIKEKMNNFGTWFMMMYLVIVSPHISKFTFSVESECFYLLIVLPLVFAYFSHTLHQTWLPKMMLLVPLSQKEKREYVEKSIQYRTNLHLFIGLVGVIAIIIFRPKDIGYAAAVFMNLFFMSYYTCGKNKKVYTKEAALRLAQNAGNEISSQGLMEGAAIITSFLFGIIYYALMFWTEDPGNNNTPVAWWVFLLFVGIEACIQIPIFIKYRKYREAVIEDACRYEGGYV